MHASSPRFSLPEHSRWGGRGGTSHKSLGQVGSKEGGEMTEIRPQDTAQRCHHSLMQWLHPELWGRLDSGVGALKVLGIHGQTLQNRVFVSLSSSLQLTMAWRMRKGKKWRHQTDQSCVQDNPRGTWPRRQTQHHSTNHGEAPRNQVEKRGWSPVATNQ